MDPTLPMPLPPPAPPPTRRLADRRLAMLLGAFGVLVVSSNIGSISAPTLVQDHPALLLALSSRIRHLLFAVPAGIAPWAYIVVPMLRLGLAAGLCFALGHSYGGRGMGWLERQLGDDKPATLRWVERGVDRAGWLMVIALPGSNVVCALVGYRRMRPTRFAVFAALGIGIRLTWVWIAAKQFESQLETALDWIARYQWPLVAVFFVITAVQSFRRAERRIAAVTESARPAEEVDQTESDDRP